MELLLPEDLIYQILLHLPVESLLKFKRVCKSWLSLIQSPNFINQHLLQYHYHHEEENIMVLDTTSCRRLYSDVSSPITILSATNFQVLEDIFQVVEDIINLPHGRLIHKKSVQIALVASYNGIICLQHGRKSFPGFSLFNPATKQLNLLPISQLPEPALSDKISVTAGFGFDAKTNDYKVLRMAKSYDMNYECVETRFEIYSLNANSWKPIEIHVPHDLDLGGGLTTLFRNGIYCWIGAFETPTPHLYSDDVDYIFPTITICPFDFSKEVFLEPMPLPDDIYDNINNNSCVQLDLLRENLACISQQGFQEYKSEWYIWMLNEYGVKESWTKLYTVWLDDLVYPIGFLNNEIICTKAYNRHERELILLNPVTDELEILPIQPRLSVNFESQVVVYKKSLVSVKPQMV